MKSLAVDRIRPVWSGVVDRHTVDMIGVDPIISEKKIRDPVGCDVGDNVCFHVS